MDIKDKSLLAKLLATEDVSIEHKNVETAYFDLKTRKIVLPNWKDMPEFLYDLFIGHEVGHALETPAEGWHNAVTTHSPNFKSFLNVVEDVRNERLMKVRYPGLVKSFFQGYQLLFKKDFFGLDKLDRTPQELPLIDRCNLHYKIGSFLALEFSDEEQVMVDACYTAETWDDVVIVAEQMFEFSKTEDAMQNLLEEQKGLEMGGSDDGEYEESDEQMENFSDQSSDEESTEEAESSDSDATDEDGVDGVESESETTGDATSDESEETDSETTESKESTKSDETSDPTKKDDSDDINEGTTNTSNPLDFDDAEPKSFTDEAFRDSESRLVETSATNGVVTAKMPKFKSKYFVFPTTKVWPEKDFTYICGDYNNNTKLPAPNARDVEKTMLDEFTHRNKSSINQLVMQFEMKRKAVAMRKARVNKTGKLNEDKLWAYKLTEDLFLSHTTVKDGQNHGMFMLVDMSGSMGRHMAGTIEQLLIQVAFCKKVGIPFDVYGFSASAMSLQNEQFGAFADPKNFQDCEDGSVLIDLEGFALLQLISSELPMSEYNRSFKKLLGYKSGFEWRGDDPRLERYSVPQHLYLGATPLSPALIVASKIAKEFKERNNIEIMNTVVLSDGENTSSLLVLEGAESTERGHLRYTDAVQREFGGYGNKSSVGKFVMKNGSRSTSVDLSDSAWRERNSIVYGSATKVMMQVYKDIVGSKMIHFFIADNNIRSAKDAWRSLTGNYAEYDRDFIAEKDSNWKNNNFMSITNSRLGSDVCFILKGAKSLNETPEFEVKSAKKADILRGFKAFQKGKSNSRQFLNRFIEEVA